MHKFALLLIVSLVFVGPFVAQSPNAAINGLVLDLSGAAIVGADVVVVNGATGVQYTTRTNGGGIYVVPNLPPGTYRIQVGKIGFKTLVKPDITLSVQDALAINFTLPIGAASEVVTVSGGAPLVDTQDAAVSTVVDRQFAENLPMNGRSFQTLIELTPGVVITTSTAYDAGQFSVNGQRASSNYWMVDGVSANVGTSAHFQGNGMGGALGSFSVLGGTNSLVSVDALQEFRIQTSTYAPEFGRTPGAQISILTRSGTNQFHGTLFDYLRNDLFDANDWFADSVGLSKPKERQNDFGGTFAGPILIDNTFFFLSYEGLRLRLPQVGLTDVPSLAARQSAAPALQPYLDAYPLPNGPASGADQAEYNSSFSNKGTLDAYSIRIDHRMGERLSLFGRYNYSPSEIDERGPFQSALSMVGPSNITTQTLTLGATWLFSPSITNDLRFNYSRVNASSRFYLDNFGGAVPLGSLGLPNSYTSQNANLFLDVFSMADGSYEEGASVSNLQRQVNLVDSITAQKGPHSLKAGFDYRRLSPAFSPFLYGQNAFFNDVPSAESGTLSFGYLQSAAGTTVLFHNLGVFAQDTWRISPSLTLTYGLRWDVDFSPSFVHGPSLPAVNGFDLTNLSGLTLAPQGRSPFRTPYGNVAPRIGVAYQLSQNQEWPLVLRGGFGVFYDLATQEVASLLGQGTYPFGALSFVSTSTFPLDAKSAAAPPITPPGSGLGTLLAFDPDLQLPYTLEWSVALEQGLGKHQAASFSYVGAAGRRLIQSADIISPNANYAEALIVSNTSTSDYHSLQVQYQRQLSNGLQALASYTLSHSIDDASSGSLGNSSNLLVPGAGPGLDRGPSDFDIRNSFTAGITYELPAFKLNPVAKAVLNGWSLESVIQARSAPPVDIYSARLRKLSGGRTRIRPDVVPGQPFYLFSSQFPGGMALNAAAFSLPPLDSSAQPKRQGDLGRNALRGFGASQWDFAVHRSFPIHEALKLQFRAEMFNVLNHPNFGPPSPYIDLRNFGRATQMLSQSLNGGNSGSNVGGGSFGALYQIGGPRSIQLAIKLMF